MGNYTYKTIIIFLLVFSIVAIFIDFIIGKKGRKKLYEIVIFNSWYSLELINTNSIIKNAAKWSSKFLNLVFGKDPISLRMLSVFGFISLFIAIVIEQFDLHFLLFRSIGYTIEVIKPDSYIAPPSFCFIVFSFGLPFAFLSFLITRFYIDKISVSFSLFSSLLYWAIDIISASIISLITFFLTGIIIFYIAPFLHYYTLLEIDFNFSFLSLPFFIITLLPTIFHTIFLLFSILLFTLELFRRFLVLILIRVDEQQKSPLTIIYLVLGSITGFLLTLIKLLN